MRLVWRLLRKHISVAQFAGFCIADMFGTLIVLAGFQFYRDVLPVFTEGDSFLKAGCLVVSKPVGAMQTGADAGSFAASEVEEIASQPFVRTVGEFTPAAYHADAAISLGGADVLRAELFMESVPDDFIDIPLENWHYDAGGKTVPIILPRSYLAMYNFGFSRSRSLPRVGEGFASMLDIDIRMSGSGRSGRYKGKVVGFSGRLNAILVPQTFMEWSNNEYAPGVKSQPTRLLVKAAEAADSRLASFLEDGGYDLSDNDMDAEKTAGFLRLLVMAVMAVGVVISALSFFMLLLSIYLLLQKNSRKLENLLLIGYSAARVALPYQILAVSLNVLALVASLVILSLLRDRYMDALAELFPNIPSGSLAPAVLLGLVLLSAVSAMDAIIIRRRVSGIFRRRG